MMSRADFTSQQGRTTRKWPNALLAGKVSFSLLLLGMGHCSLRVFSVLSGLMRGWIASMLFLFTWISQIPTFEMLMLRRCTAESLRDSNNFPT